MAGNRFMVGIAIFAAGLIIILGKLGVIGFLWHAFWPILLLLLGMLLHVLYYNRMVSSAVLIPGGILVTYSLLFMYAVFFGWHTLSYMWPFFLLGIAVGLYEYSRINRYEKQIYGLSLLFFAGFVVFLGITLLIKWGIVLLAVLLLAVGAGFISKRIKFF